MSVFKRKHYVRQIDREVAIGEVFECTCFDFPVHPAALAFPEMQGDAFTDLCESIYGGGLLVPIDLFIAGPGDHSQVLDGRNRQNALRRIHETCQDSPPPGKYRLLDEHSLGGLTPEQYAFSKNYDRRDLTKGQRALIHAEKLDLVKAQCKRRMLAGQALAQGQKGKATDIVGEQAGVCGESIRFAMTLLDRGIDDLLDAVRNGWLPLYTAYRLSSEPTERIHELLHPKLDYPNDCGQDERNAYRVQYILQSIRGTIGKNGSPARKKTSKRKTPNKRYPPQVRPAFAQAAKVQGAIERLETLWNDGAAEVFDPRLLRSLRAIVDKLEESIPRKPCPKLRNKTHGDDCQVCGGKGWLAASEVQENKKRADQNGKDVNDE